VDDNPHDRRVLGAIWEKWGCSYTAITDPRQAVDTLHQAQQENNPYRCGVFDMMMPGMDGVELALHLRENAAPHPPLSLVMLSSAGLGQEERALKEAGYNAILHKPIREQVLRETLLELPDLQSGSEEPAAPEEPAAAPPHLLVAEDNLVNQKVIQKFLERLGVEATVVPNGLEALDAIGEGQFDAVLMDLHMPGMDGLEVTRTHRERETGSRLPIIALTADAIKGDEQKCYDAGMDDYISKPVRMEVLREVLARYVTVT